MVIIKYTAGVVRIQQNQSSRKNPLRWPRWFSSLRQPYCYQTWLNVSNNYTNRTTLWCCNYRPLARRHFNTANYGHNSHLGNNNKGYMWHHNDSTWFINTTNHFQQRNQSQGQETFQLTFSYIFIWLKVGISELRFRIIS